MATATAPWAGILEGEELASLTLEPSRPGRSEPLPDDLDPRVASAHFGARGVPVEIIELSGSVELAPVLGLSDCIVDLVETGRTLAENGLAVVETITESTGRLVVNRASYQLKSEAVGRLISDLSRVVNEGGKG